MSLSDTDELIPDLQVRREFGGISEMTIWRWDRDPQMAALGWPQPTKICNRKYRSRRGINAFREACVSSTISRRDLAAA